MVLTFVDASLATICNSERRLVAQWGRDGFDRIGRRLGELAAVDGTDLEHLPSIDISNNPDGSVTLSFDRGDLMIHGVPTRRAEPIADIGRADGLEIMAIEVTVDK